MPRPKSAGDLVREASDARPPYWFRVDGASLVLQKGRLAWLGDLAPVLLCVDGAAVLLETDSRIPAAVRCGLGTAIVVRQARDRRGHGVGVPRLEVEAEKDVAHGILLDGVRRQLDPMGAPREWQIETVSRRATRARRRR